jgi:hypothetical protein
MYRTEILKERFFLKFPDNLIFNVYMLKAHSALKHRIKFFPISWREEDQISNVKMARQTYQMTDGLLKYFFGGKKYLFEQDHRAKAIQEYVFNEVPLADYANA